MKGEFEETVRKFPEWLEKITKSPAYSRNEFSKVPKKGVYIFYNKENHPLYVGRSDSMRTRLLVHNRPSSGHNAATFAFLLAKEIWDPSHHDDTRTREQLEADDKFSQLYSEKKKDVAAMQVRVIEIAGPASQALFEIYASLELDTPYNDWENH